ncbi:ubinuclein-2 isoform X2 [Parasteatoda tepidariorum]|uniref:ubinuclein-2 isoform X2 n=1 Tax=Parasteatoda tepidariorum TaxID=114398 RepID=UPI00077F866A|nr:ubinuclein-2 isoform X2 [Parasteatoda tepidariorum]
MAESKRITLDAPKALQREKKVKEIPPTFRFDLNLNVNDKNTDCAEFSYAELVKEARSSEQESKQIGSDDPFSLDENVEELQAIARKFEEKYNPKPGRKKKKKMAISEDYIDKGMGYDETDPFIDNGEAYDELVPSSLSTKFGGFYINKGELEFRNNSESENGTDGKPRKKRIKQGTDKEKKKRRFGFDENQKRRGRKPFSDSESALMKPKKKPQLTVADMLQQHKEYQQRIQQENIKKMQLIPIPVEREVESEEFEEDNVETPSQVLQIPGQASTISEAIESVVKAAAEDMTSNGSAGLITGSSDGEEAKIPAENLEAPRLPENLPPELDVVVAQLKEAAYRSEEGKCKFFSDEVNRMLLSVELRAQELTSAQRSIIYAHLASHLPCTKETLQKRAKKLRLDQEDGKLREPMQRLRDGIASVMPAMIEKYTALVKAYDARDENKKIDVPIGTDGEESQEEGDKKASHFPKKRFEWNDTIRKYLCDVVRIKLKCYEVSKTRIQSAEEYLKHFLEAEVKNLWPPGWMQSRILFRESRAAHFSITNRPKKQILIPKKLNPLTPVMLTMKPAVSLLNNTVITQESDYEQSVHDKSVPLLSSVENAVEKREHVDVMSSNQVLSSEERAAELAKLFAFPLKSVITDEYSVLKSHESVASTSKVTYELPPKTPSPHHVNTISDSLLGSKPATPKSDKHSKLTQNKQTTFSPKVPDFNTFAEGSLASDMLARIICASLADFPYAGSQNTDNTSSKSASVISPNPSVLKESRTSLPSKYSSDTHTSPKKIDIKPYNFDARKSSQDSGHNFPNLASVESFMSAKNQSIQRSSDAINKSKNHSDISSAVNLKLKDSIVPHSRQFAEAFEKTDIPPIQKHNPKSVKYSAVSSIAMTNASSRLISEHLSDYPSSTSPRTSLESTQKVPFDLAKYSSAISSQGTVTAPYKKRSKYSQSGNKTSDQWSHFLDASLGPSLLEGMKGFPFPVSSLPTPPPAHSSSPHRTSAHSQHNSSRTTSHISPGLRSIHESKSDTTNHNTQAHSNIVTSSEIQRRQSLIQGPWKSSSSQSPSTSLSHFMASTSPPISNPCKSTSPNHHNTNSHAIMSPVPAHSMSQIEKATSAYNRSHSPLPLRASPSHMSLSHPVKTSSPSNTYSHLVTPPFTTHQSSHSVSSNLHQAVVRNTYDPSNLTTTSNSTAGTYTTNQETKTVNPRTN